MILPEHEFLNPRLFLIHRFIRVREIDVLPIGNIRAQTPRNAPPCSRSGAWVLHSGSTDPVRSRRNALAPSTLSLGTAITGSREAACPAGITSVPCG